MSMEIIGDQVQRSFRSFAIVEMRKPKVEKDPHVRIREPEMTSNEKGVRLEK